MAVITTIDNITYDGRYLWGPYEYTFYQSGHTVFDTFSLSFDVNTLSNVGGYSGGETITEIEADFDYNRLTATLNNGVVTVSLPQPSYEPGQYSDIYLRSAMNGNIPLKVHFGTGTGNSSYAIISFVYTFEASPVLTYDTNGGTFTTTPTSQYREYGSTVTLATDIAREGYQFNGWKVGDYYNVTTVVMDGDKTAVAQWGTLNTYTLEFYANGGSGAPPTQTVETTAAGYTFTIPSTIPTRAGHTFQGWSSTLYSPDEGSAEYQPGDTVSVWLLRPYKQICAVWTINTYTVTVSPNYSTYGSVSPTTISAKYGSSVTVSGQTITIGSTVCTATPHEDTVGYTYYFSRWKDYPNTITADCTIYAVFGMLVRNYDVSLYASPSSSQSSYGDYGSVTASTGGGGGVVLTLTTYYGAEIRVDPNNPNILRFGLDSFNTYATALLTKSADQQYTYAFDRWELSPSGNTISGPTAATAVFTRSLRTYTVTFYKIPDGYGTTSLPSVDAQYGTEISVSGAQLSVGNTTVTAIPTASDAQYTYSFDRWANVPETVDGSKYITAKFTRSVNTYTVIWKSQDGQTTLETDHIVPYGNAPSYDSTAPTKAATAQYTYTFAGWATVPNQESGAAIADLPTVSGDTTYYAAFSKTIRKYTVTWKNYDNTTILEIDYNVEYDTTPTYNGATPIKPATAQHYYTFSGWSPTVAPVTGDVTYTAQYTENEVTLYITDNGVVKVFDWETFEYVPVNSAPFVLILQPNGGLFKYDTLKPSIKVNTCKRTTDNGATTQLAVPAMYDHYEPLYYTTLSDGTGAFIWAMTYDSCTEISLDMTNLPTVANSGLTAPPGFDKISAWEIHIPYTKFAYDSSETPASTPFTMTMTRASTENFRHVSADPCWVPMRDGVLRCLTVTPGMGSLDFGTVQGISRTYNASLSTIPIVCYGYTGSFCMDLGVSETVSVNYMRVSPTGKVTINDVEYDLPYNGSSDSRHWSNAYWISKLKELTNRWQMRTNGSMLYLKRPNLERLTNGMPQSETSPPEDDPMMEYLSEIDGDNCYITSAPIKYDTANPHMIRSSVTFKIGTLYPKQSPYSMSKVTYTWPGHPERTRIVSYPSSITAVLPSLPLDWGAIYENGVYSVAVGWKIDNTGYQPGDYFNTPSTGNTLTVNVNVESSESVSAQFITDATKTYTVSGGRFIIAYAVGGGGGGGAAYLHVIDGQILASAGGAGGASGGASSKQITYTNSATISVTIGFGGTKGTYNGSDSEGTDGSPGSATIISINSIQRVYARGGEGGKHATGNFNPGTYGLSTQSAVDNYVAGHAGSYPGGDGGISVDRASNNAANGGDGHSDASYNLHGLGGIADNHDTSIGTTWYYYRMGGGGGGGGPTWPNSSTCASFGGYAGSGRDPPSDRSVDGARGSGGGGGGGRRADMMRPEDAGDGGDGFVYIVAPNGTITEN